MPDRIYIELEREEVEKLALVCEQEARFPARTSGIVPEILGRAAPKLRAALGGGVLPRDPRNPRGFTRDCPDCQPGSGEGEDWPEHYEKLRRGVGPLVATTYCLKRPKYKHESWGGPCGQCAPCLAKAAYEAAIPAPEGSDRG